MLETLNHELAKVYLAKMCNIYIHLEINLLNYFLSEGKNRSIELDYFYFWFLKFFLINEILDKCGTFPLKQSKLRHQQYVENGNQN